MISAKRAQLNEYFAAEMAALRSSAVEFSQENPSIANELKLNKHNEGKSQDPHIEMLLQSFAWMTSRLRQNIESEAKKLPSLLLQQLYPQLISSIPSMAIAECKIDGGGAEFNQGYQLNGQTKLEPLAINEQADVEAKLATCYMSTCYPTRLWPLSVKAVKTPSLDMIKINKNSPAQSAISLDIEELTLAAAKETQYQYPLRFFINLAAPMCFELYDFIAKYFIGAVLLDEHKNTVATLSAKQLKLCGFDDQERLFPDFGDQDLGFTLLQDYFCFPEKFMFFELSGLNALSGKSKFRIVMLFNENLPSTIKLTAQSIKLNCLPVINLYEKTTEPLPVHQKEYRYKLYPSREHYDCHEIVQIKQMFSINKNGENTVLAPYFSLSSGDESLSSYRWMVQQENSHRKELSGTETWLSVFNSDYQKESPLGDTLYASAYVCNRSACELFPRSQLFSIVGSSPVKQVTLLTCPTRHRGSQLDQEHLWKMLSHLSIYYVSLSDPTLAKETLKRFLGLYANKNNSASQRQIDSICSLEVEDDVQPDLSAAWRGYYQGKKFTLTLNERKFDGGSAILFAGVLRQFLALFCHINSFVRMEVKFNHGSAYQWQPISGHKIIA